MYCFIVKSSGRNLPTPQKLLIFNFGDQIFPEIPFPKNINVDINGFNNL